MDNFGGGGFGGGYMQSGEGFGSPMAASQESKVCIMAHLRQSLVNWRVKLLTSHWSLLGTFRCWGYGVGLIFTSFLQKKN